MSAEDDKEAKPKGKRAASKRDPDNGERGTAAAKKTPRKRGGSAAKRRAAAPATTIDNEPGQAADATTAETAADGASVTVTTVPAADVEAAVAVPTPAAPGSQPSAPSPTTRPAPSPTGHDKPVAAPVSDESVAAIAADASAAERPLLLRTRLDVRWGDMDAFNHVNNAVFLTYLEEARLRWLQALPGPWLDDNTAPLLAAANVNYRRPIEWPSRVSVELYADRVGNSSLTIGHRVIDARDPAVVYSDGHTVMVWIDRRNGKASRLPPAVRQACTAGVKRDRGNG